MRTVSASMEVWSYGQSEIELQVAVARTPGLTVTDELTVDHYGRSLDMIEIAAPHHGRQHILTLPDGLSRLTYNATVEGEAEVPPADPMDLSVHRRPSRYATSDEFGGFAVSEFGHLSHQKLLPAISAWVGTRLQYSPGSSGPTDGAVQTLLKGAGVCRDYAHLVTTLLRALGISARLTAVYAPGCVPMDFHAVVEAYVEGGWYVVDATALAPRSSLVRIATGRDAADTAFMSTIRGNVALNYCGVTAVADDGLPDDDLYQLVRIS